MGYECRKYCCVKCKNKHIKWNINLTKETDKRVKKNGKNISKKRLEIFIVGKNSNNYNRYKKFGICKDCHKKKKTIWHHKDGNRKNNKRKNLKEVCPYCHRCVEHKKELLQFKYHNKGKTHWNYKPRKIFKCLNCGKKFKDYAHYNRKFCSKKCSAIIRVKKYRTSHIKQLICKVCGKMYQRMPCNIHQNTRYCSLKCLYRRKYGSSQ